MQVAADPKDRRQRLRYGTMGLLSAAVPAQRCAQRRDRTSATRSIRADDVTEQMAVATRMSVSLHACLVQRADIPSAARKGKWGRSARPNLGERKRIGVAGFNGDLERHGAVMAESFLETATPTTSRRERARHRCPAAGVRWNRSYRERRIVLKGEADLARQEQNALLKLLARHGHDHDVVRHLASTHLEKKTYTPTRFSMSRIGLILVPPPSSSIPPSSETNRKAVQVVGHGGRVVLEEAVERGHEELLAAKLDLVGQVLQDLGDQDEHAPHCRILQAGDHGAQAVLQRLDQRRAEETQEQEPACIIAPNPTRAATKQTNAQSERTTGTATARRCAPPRTHGLAAAAGEALLHLTVQQPANVDHLGRHGRPRGQDGVEDVLARRLELGLVGLEVFTDVDAVGIHLPTDNEGNTKGLARATHARQNAKGRRGGVGGGVGVGGVGRGGGGCAQATYLHASGVAADHLNRWRERGEQVGAAGEGAAALDHLGRHTVEPEKRCCAFRSAGRPGRDRGGRGRGRGGDGDGYRCRCRGGSGL